MEDRITARIQEMKASIGHDSDTLLLGYLMGAFGMPSVTGKPIASLNPEKYNNRGMAEEEAHKVHLQYLCDMFGLENLEHAEAFSAYFEEKLEGIYRKLAESETEFGGGEKMMVQRLLDNLMRTIDIEAAKERGIQRQ